VKGAVKIELLYALVRLIKVVIMFALVTVHFMWWLICNLIAGLAGRKKRLSVFRRTIR
jgi:hypothetical protein